MLNRVGARLWGTPRRAIAAAAAVILLLVVGATFAPATRDLSVILVALGIIGAVAKAYPDETRTFLGWALGHLAWASQTVDREAVRNVLEGTLSAGAARLNAQCAGAAPSKVELRFVRSQESIDELPDGTLVLGISQHKDRTRNLIAAAWAFARLAVARDARPHLDPQVSRGIDIVVAKELLLHEDPRAINDFIRSVWEPSVKDADRLKQLTTKLERVQDERFLGPVILTEFIEMGSAYATRLPDGVVAEESADFVEYMYEVATHEPDASVNRDFARRVFRCRALYVARPQTAAVGARPPALRAVDYAMAQGFKSVYLLARGRQVEYLRELQAELADDDRVKDLSAYPAKVVTSSGALKDQLILRVCVDLRLFVSIGPRPIEAVGPRGEASARRVASQRLSA